MFTCIYTFFFSLKLYSVIKFANSCLICSGRERSKPYISLMKHSLQALNSSEYISQILIINNRIPFENELLLSLYSILATFVYLLLN